MRRFIGPSVDVAFGRQAAGRRRELDVVGAAGDDAVAGGHAAANTDAIAVARGDLDEPPGEALAAVCTKT